MAQDLLTPENIAAGAAAARTAIQTVKEVLGIFKDAKDLLPEGQREAADTAIAESEKQLKIADAQVASALGYQLCRCEYPPLIMLRVGHMIRDHLPKYRAGDPVYECPSCHDTTAGPWGYQRKVASSESR